MQPVSQRLNPVHLRLTPLSLRLQPVSMRMELTNIGLNQGTNIGLNQGSHRTKPLGQRLRPGRLRLMLRCYRIERGSLRIEQLGQRGSIVSLKHRTTSLILRRERLRPVPTRLKPVIDASGIDASAARYIAKVSIAM